MQINFAQRWATKKPRSQRKRGLLATRNTRGKPDYMLSIMTWPKPEHDTWVAPSIRRAKS